MSSGIDCSRRPDQPHKMPGCRVVALFWVRPNHHEQRNGEQKRWEQWKVECTYRSNNIVQGRALSCTPVCRVWTYPRKDGQAEWAWAAWINTVMVDQPKVVTNPSTNRDRRSLTSLMWRTPLRQRQTSHVNKWVELTTAFARQSLYSINILLNGGHAEHFKV